MRVTSIEIIPQMVNAGRDRIDTATRETYYNPDTSRRDVARDVLCGNSRLQASPRFIAGSRWLTVYLHIVDEFRRGVTLLSARARVHISTWVCILYEASNISRVISKRRNDGACTEKFRVIFESRKLMPQVVNNSRCDCCYRVYR